jgi:hypothetical protein
VKRAAASPTFPAAFFHFPKMRDFRRLATHFFRQFRRRLVKRRRPNLVSHEISGHFNTPLLHRPYANQSI